MKHNRNISARGSSCDKKKKCCSTRLQGNQNQGAGIDRVFWENVPNLVDIEREHS